MALHFLSDDAATAAVGDEVVLTGGEAHHAAQVRRLRAGEAVTVGDGRGVWLEGEAVSVTPKQVVVRVGSRMLTPEPSARLVLVQALAKGDRDELAVQAATELGVDEIVPWQAERSVSRWDGKVEKGLARWRTIVREAAKQAHRPWVPEVTDPAGVQELAARAAESRMLVLDPRADARLSEVGLSDPADGSRGDIVLVVGPEGGISDAELALLAEAGAQRVRLGDTVLRTSTAGAAALSVVSVRLARW